MLHPVREAAQAVEAVLAAALEEFADVAGTSEAGTKPPPCSPASTARHPPSVARGTTGARTLTRLDAAGRPPASGSTVPLRRGPGR